MSVVSYSRPDGFEAMFWKLCLKLPWKGQMITLIISLKRQLLYGVMELSTGSYMLTLHVTCVLQGMFFVP